jgi:hypothetical protein
MNVGADARTGILVRMEMVGGRNRSGAATGSRLLVVRQHDDESTAHVGCGLRRYVSVATSRI